MFLRRAAEITAWQLEEQRIPDANTRASTYIEVTDTCFEGDDGRDRHAGQALRGYTTRRTEADERPAVRKLEEKLEKQQRGAGDTSVVVLCSGVELEPWPPWARGRCASGLYGRPRAHLSGYQRQATLRIGTSAFRLIDRARVPTNLRISRPGPHQVSHTSIQHHLSTTTNPPPPSFLFQHTSSPAAKMSDSTVGQTKQFGKGERTVPHPSQKAQKWYPVDDEPQPKKVSTPFVAAN